MTAEVAQRAPSVPPAPAEGPEPLLASKFAVPTAPRFMVPRDRLVDRLSRGRGEPVTVITGPAGSGKTQLAAEWVRSARMPDDVVWITMEEGDSKPSAFWTYVVEGLRRAGLPLLLGTAAPAPADRTFLTRLSAELAEQDRAVTLVLDDVSTLSDAQWAHEMDFLIRHCYERLRLVLVGRWDPPLPLHRYRLAGKVTEIRGEDLAFTADEATRLLTLHGLTPSPSALRTLLGQTEGWAAGLRLCAMALQGRQDADEFVSTISGDEASIAEYFVEEVLRTQPPDIRDFLLRTSVVDTLSPELADALTGRDDGRRTLALLEHENAFLLPVSRQPARYRYHPLFGELLRAEMAFGDPEENRRLHRSAAQWLLAEGHTLDAVGHAASAGDWDTAAAIAVDDLAVVRLALVGADNRLGTLFRDLPADPDDPAGALVATALRLGRARPGASSDALARARELVHRRPGDAMSLTAAMLEVVRSWMDRDVSGIRDAVEVAWSLLPSVPRERLDRHPELSALLLIATATAHSWQGEVEAAASELADAASAANAPGCEFLRMEALQHLALLDAGRGRLRNAAVLADQAVDQARRAQLPPDRQPTAAEVARAWVATERYDVEAAWRHLRTAEPLCAATADGLSAAALALVKSRLMRARGEIRAAEQVLRDARSALGGNGPVWLEREIVVTHARLLTLSGHTDDTLRLLDELPDTRAADTGVAQAEALLARGERAAAERILLPVTEATGVEPPVLIDAWLVRATAALDGGDTGGARANLRQALRLAERESQRRAFHEAGVRLRRILRDDRELADRYRALGRCRPGRPAPDARSERPEPVIVDTLSEREMEVLRYLAGMWPTEEIAAAMYVSVNTVKTHIRSILRKLAASRRNEAVRRARSLGLI